MKRSFHKTRIAPTPSGFLHIGNIYSFLTTAELAKQYGASILLRIDDLDRKRADESFINDIFNTLHFMGIAWQEGPADTVDFEQHYSQVHRLPLYNAALQKLAVTGNAYACTCSRTDILKYSPDGIYNGACRNKNLPMNTPDANWRLKTDLTKPVYVHNTDGIIITTQLPSAMQDFVVRKKDGFPAYQLASVVDDVYFNVDLIVRGKDLYDSTLAQLYLAGVLQEEKFLSTCFHHHPLLKTAAGEKMSKSAGDTSIQFLRNQGKTAEDIIGMLSEFGFAGLKD